MKIINSDETVALCTGEKDGGVGCGTRVILVYEDLFVRIAQRGRQYFRCPKCGLMSPLNYQIPPPVPAAVPEGKLPEPEPVDTARCFWGFEQSTWSRSSPARTKTFLYATKEKAETTLKASSEALDHISRVGDDQDYTKNSEVMEYHIPRDTFPEEDFRDNALVGRSLLKYRVKS